MTKEDQINIINSTINKARENLRPLSFNLIFWGVMINLMSAFHYFFEPIVEYSKYSVLLYWTIIPILGMVYDNMEYQKRNQKGIRNSFG